MEYLNVRQAALAWGVSPRYVQRLLSDGRIQGAQKYGRAWMIPAHAEKPPDPRRERGLPSCAASPYLSCVLLSAVVPMPAHDPEAALATLPNEAQRAQYRAELAYLRGDFEAVKTYFTGVSPQDAAYLCAANITVCAAMCTRDYPLFRHICAAVKEIELNAASPAARLSASLLPVLAAVSMNAPELAPRWLINGDLWDFAPDARPMLVYMRVKYLQSIGDHSGMLAAAQTALALLKRKSGVTLTDVYLTCLCACGCYALGRADEAREYLARSVALCEKGGFVSPLGEYTTWVGGYLETALKNADPEFERAVNRHIEGTLKNWLFFHNEFAKDKATLILTTKEYQLALLLKEGKTYAQAAEQLCISVGRVKNLISIIYQKLGVSKKAEIARHLF